MGTAALAAGGGRPLPTLLVLAALALIPFALLMLTSFIKIVVVLSLARNALGTQAVPPNMVIVGLAALLSIFVMAPTARSMWDAAEPALAGQDPDAPSTAALLDAGKRAREPLRAFLARHAHARDRAVFADMARRLDPPRAPSISDGDLMVVMPAFVTSELKEAFQIGFLLFLPFLVIDLVVAAALAAMGLGTLSPGQVSLAFKLLLFVAVDGWILLSRGLLTGYA